MFCSLQLIVRNHIIDWSDDNGDEMTFTTIMTMVMFNMIMKTKIMIIIIIKMTRTMMIIMMTSMMAIIVIIRLRIMIMMSIGKILWVPHPSVVRLKVG